MSGEPWHRNGSTIQTSHGIDVALVWMGSDADRIKACVNALDGVSTAAIEAGAVRELVKAARLIIDTGKHHELVAALKPFEEVQR